MVDTTKIADGIDGLGDREIKAGGFKLTIGSVLAIFAFLSTIVGGLYGGFVLYQKIEEVAGLDLGAYQQQMDVMDAKVTGISEKVEESVEYTRDIKNGLKDDLLRVEQQTWTAHVHFHISLYTELTRRGSGSNRALGCHRQVPGLVPGVPVRSRGTSLQR